MGRLIGILLAILPFVLAWGGLLLNTVGRSDIAERIAGIVLFRSLAWCALALGGFIVLANVYVAFVRPLILQALGTPPAEQEYVSGLPLMGSAFLMVSTIPLFPLVGPSIAVTVLLLLDTGGPLWFLICTWHCDDFWTNKKPPTDTSTPGEDDGKI